MSILSDFLIRASRKQYSLVFRIISTILGALLFLVVFPLLAFWGGGVFLTGYVFPGVLSSFVAVILFVFGLPWVIWSVAWQLTKGQGTPVPVVPTKNFLVNGPYTYTRNPMIMGFYLYLLGWACWFNRWGALAVAGIIIILLYLYLKYVEEPELTGRFGEAYKQYKRKTPFMLPRFRSR